jgi:ComF family protein
MWRYNLPQDLILVPVPLHPSRKNWRGFNQAELLAVELSKRFKVRINSNLIVRVINTKTQVGLSREERKKNIKGAFRISQSARHRRGSPEAAKYKGKSFILVDDVFTTGATMAEAAKVLKNAGAANVWAMTVALD